MRLLWSLTVAWSALVATSRADEPPPRHAAAPTDAEARALFRKASTALIKHAPAPDWWWNVAVDIGRAQLAAGDRDGAKTTFSSTVQAVLASRDPNDEALLQVALGMIDGGFSTEARAPLRAAIVIAMKDWHDPKVRGRQRALSILEAQVRAGDSEGRDETLGLFEERTNGAHPLRSTTRTDMFDFYTRMAARTMGGREESAFREVGRYSMGAGARPDVAISILSRMASAVRCRPAEEARPILGRIRGMLDALDQKPEVTAQAYYYVAHSLAIAGDVRQAHALAKTIDSVGIVHYQAFAMAEIGIARTAHGDGAGARDDLRAAFEIGEGFANDGGGSLWYLLAHAQARVGDGRGVRATLVHVEPVFWVDVLTELATYERAHGDEKTAALSLGEAEKAVRLILAKEIDSTADRELAASVRRAGAKIKNPGRFAMDLAVLARIRVASGHSDSAQIAIDAIAQVADPNPRDDRLAQAQRELAIGRVIHGDLNRAIEEALALPTALERCYALGGAANEFLDWTRAEKLR